MVSNRISAVGRRKTSVARVWAKPGKPGAGRMIINHRDCKEYLVTERAYTRATAPLKLLNLLDGLDIKAAISGGGMTGQADALLLAIARLLLKIKSESPYSDLISLSFDELKKLLRSHGYLTRDARAVERKKFGLHKARKALQYSKR